MTRKNNHNNWNREPEAPKTKTKLRTFTCKNCKEQFESNYDADECTFCGSHAIKEREE
ncbi:hypothetical protein L6259_01015 [Candidatus Parcubacteria bacterium]|nr:hypothetical protein [Candidatus Parcubacteria bacterium]